MENGIRSKINTKSTSDTYMLCLGFLRSRYDRRVYNKYENSHILILVMHVDDFLFIGNGKRMI